MRVTVVGIQKGVSKKGNNFCLVHYLAESDKVKGHIANNCFVPAYIDADTFELNQEYRFEFVNGSLGHVEAV